MANSQRGEVVLRIGGTEHRLCLTLGGLAEIEALMSDGGALDGQRLVRVLAILLRGGGSDVPVPALRETDLESAVRAVTDCLEAGQ